MKNVEKLVNEYREAIAREEGEQVASVTIIEIRGEDAIFVKRPHEQTGQVVTVGRLKLMIQYEKDHLTRHAA